MPGYIGAALIVFCLQFVIRFANASKKETTFGNCVTLAIGEMIGRTIALFLTACLIYAAGLSLPGLDGIFSQWTLLQAFCATYIVYAFFGSSLGDQS